LQRAGVEIDPYLNDPLRWGASMAHHSELMLRAFDAISARSVIEVGAYAGDLTRVLAAWAAAAGASVVAVDPSPQEQLVALAAGHDGIELVRRTSLEALPEIALADVIIIDGDHNYYTVSEELRLIAERAAGQTLPLLLFHDVCWPHGRRDDYFDPSQIPAEYRRPIAGERHGIFPGDAGTRADGLPYPRSAATEGGARNGVLTAVEDFVAGAADLRLVVVPAFFGFGAVWSTEARWADEVAEVLEPWDRHPLLERLETNRVLHIAGEHALRTAVWDAQERQTRQENVLRRLLQSSAFAVAERLSKLRVRAGVAPRQSVISRDEVRRALEQPRGSDARD
jgi:Methyltransferase domain